MVTKFKILFVALLAMVSGAFAQPGADDAIYISGVKVSNGAPAFGASRLDDITSGSLGALYLYDHTLQANDWTRRVVLAPYDAPATHFSAAPNPGLSVSSSDDSYYSMHTGAGLEGYSYDGLYNADFRISSITDQFFNALGLDRDFTVGINGNADFFRLDSSATSLITEGALVVGDASYSPLYQDPGDMIFGGSISTDGFMAFKSDDDALYFGVGTTQHHQIISNGSTIFNSGYDADNDFQINGTSATELSFWDASANTRYDKGDYNWDTGNITFTDSTGIAAFANQITATGGVKTSNVTMTSLGISYTAGNTVGHLHFLGSGVVELKATNPIVGDVEIRGQSSDDYVAITSGRFEVQEQANYTRSTLTISSGAVTQTKTYHIIAAESGTADDLATINGPYATGTIIYLEPDSGDTITAKDGTGNMKLAGDFAMDDTSDKLFLIYDGSNWNEVSRSSNN